MTANAHLTCEVIFTDLDGPVLRSIGSSEWWWGRLASVHVRIHPERRPAQVSATGIRCKRDGTPDGRIKTTTRISVEIPNTAIWIERARAIVRTRALDGRI